MHAVIFGGSRGIGYFAAWYLLQDTAPTSDKDKWTVSLLLRKVETIAEDPKFKEYLDTGRLKLVQGDAFVEADVRGILGGEKVDVILSTIGGYPTLTLAGIRLAGRPDICTQGMVVLLKVLGSQPEPHPRLIGVTSMGMGDNHNVMPLVLRIIYPWLLHHPHLDKEGMEYLLRRASSSLPTPTTHIPPPHILNPDVIPSIPENFLREIINVRPALLLGGDAPPDENQRPRAAEDLYTYSVKRSEVGRFIVEECLPGSDQWVNKAPVVGY